MPFSTQNCLMTENWKESLDQGGHYGALLTDLSKACDCIMYDVNSKAPSTWLR